MIEREALKLALEALEGFYEYGYDRRECFEHITAIKEALVQEKALQALHDENERLGLYKDAYAQPESEPARLQCVTCGTVYADGVPPQVAQPAQVTKYSDIVSDGGLDPRNTIKEKNYD